uniref:Uncharacterized protein n=1 Tax=Romanomermis culicivorax TaxID=13658 RepID=A0A915KC65_ROMCU
MGDSRRKQSTFFDVSKKRRQSTASINKIKNRRSVPSSCFDLLGDRKISSIVESMTVDDKQLAKKLPG